MPDDDQPLVDPLVVLEALAEQFDASMKFMADRCAAYAATLREAGVPANLHPMLVAQLHEVLLAKVTER